VNVNEAERDVDWECRDCWGFSVCAILKAVKNNYYRRHVTNNQLHAASML
jgi:hypothetical protein